MPGPDTRSPPAVLAPRLRVPAQPAVCPLRDCVFQCSLVRDGRGELCIVEVPRGDSEPRPTAVFDGRDLVGATFIAPEDQQAIVQRLHRLSHLLRRLLARYLAEDPQLAATRQLPGRVEVQDHGELPAVLIWVVNVPLVARTGLGIDGDHSRLAAHSDPAELLHAFAELHNEAVHLR